MEPTDSEPTGTTYAYPISDQADNCNERELDRVDGTPVLTSKFEQTFPNAPVSLPYSARQISSHTGDRVFNLLPGHNVEEDSVRESSLPTYPDHFDGGRPFESCRSSSIPTDIPLNVVECAESQEYSDSGTSLTDQNGQVSSDATVQHERAQPGILSLEDVTLPQGKIQLPSSVHDEASAVSVNIHEAKQVKSAQILRELGKSGFTREYSVEENVDSLVKSLENISVKDEALYETEVKLVAQVESPTDSLTLTQHDDACVPPEILGLNVRSKQNTSPLGSTNSLKGQDGSLGSRSETQRSSLNGIKSLEVIWDTLYGKMPKTVNPFWLPARQLSEYEEMEYYRKHYSMLIKRLLEADTRNLALKSLFVKLHETNQKCLIQHQQLQELKKESEVSKQSLRHMAQMMDQQILTFSDVLFIFLIKNPDKGDNKAKQDEKKVDSKPEVSRIKPESSTGPEKSKFLSKLATDWSMSVKGNDTEEKVTVEELLQDLGVAMTDARAVSSLMLNLVQEIVRLKQTMSEEMTEKFGDSMSIYLEAQEYEEVVSSLKNQIGQLEFALATLRKALFSQKYGHYDTLIQIIYDLQEKLAKKDQVLSTEIEMNRGFQHTIDKLSAGKEMLERKIQELAKEMEKIVKQQKESIIVEEKEISSLDENKKDEEIKQLESKIATLYKTHSEEREAMQKEIHLVSEQLNRSENEKSHVQDLHKELQKRYQQITDAKTQYAETFPAILNDLRMQKDALQEKISFLQRDVTRLEDQSEIKDAQLAWAEKEINKIKAETEKDKMTQVQLLSRYKQESALMQQQMKQWESQVGAMSKMLSQEQKEKQKYMELFSQLRNQAAAAKLRTEQSQPHSLMAFPHYQQTWGIPRPMREVVTADNSPKPQPMGQNLPKAKPRYICSKCFKNNFNDQADYEQHFHTCTGEPTY